MRVFAYSSIRWNKFSKLFKESDDICWWGLTNCPYNNKVIRFLSSFVKIYQYKPNVIFLDSAFGVSNIFLCVFAKIKHIPLIIRSRGGFDGEFKSMFKSNIIGKVYNFYKIILAIINYNLCSHIISVSEYHKKQIKKIGIEDNKITVIINPLIKSENEVMVNKKCLDESKYLLTITNFNYQKKIEPLLDYLPHILNVIEKLPEWKVIIAGGGKYLKDVKVLVNNKKVEFTGHYKPISELYKKCDCFFYLTGLDAAPNVVMEAQKYNKPLIVNNHPSLFEFINLNSVLVINKIDQIEYLFNKLINDIEYRKKAIKFNKEYIDKKTDYKILQDKLYITLKKCGIINC